MTTPPAAGNATLSDSNRQIILDLLKAISYLLLSGKLSRIKASTHGAVNSNYGGKKLLCAMITLDDKNKHVNYSNTFIC